MGRRGPKPEPTAIRLVKGDTAHRPLPKNEPKPRPITPTCPSWLTAIAKVEWKRVVPELEAIGLLTIVDRMALAAYCQAYSRWRECEKVLSVEGPTYETHSAQGGRMVRARPEVAQGQAYLGLVAKFCAEFGLTPSARCRMTVPGKPETSECAKCTLPLEMCGCG